MTLWVRVDVDGQTRFGTLAADDRIRLYDGDMFGTCRPSGVTVEADKALLLPPCQPTKMLALWNNFNALATKLGNDRPMHPLYLLKANSSFLGPGGAIRRPASYDGRVVFEGELGIVIGRRCSNATEAEATRCIFGYTGVNDITAIDLVTSDKSFAQWCRAKSFDTFGVFGPAISDDLDVAAASVVTVLNGVERQNYSLGDMIFPPAEIVRRISADMTLMPGDIICCGTSIGAGTMKEPRNLIAVTIAGIGTLANRFDTETLI
ncbi:MAG: fumarylacetoacetate hydrolase [Rhodospirillales bacterium]|nr:fumarylacetoacetate hydrolase [Rhodospirillales bacterium]